MSAGRAQVIAAVVAVAGCAEHGRSLLVVDAAIDANLLDAPCLLPHSEPCNLLTQTGCPLDEKCTWLHSLEVPAGFRDCAPSGSRLEGETCVAVEGHLSNCTVMTTDDCVAGTYCDVGVCRAICDLVTPACTTGTCTMVDGVFLLGGMYAHGLCEP